MMKINGRTARTVERLQIPQLNVHCKVEPDEFSSRYAIDPITEVTAVIIIREAQGTFSTLTSVVILFSLSKFK